MEKSALLSVREASEILGISSATVKNWIKLGKIKGCRKGARFVVSLDEIEQKSDELTKSSALTTRRNKSRLTSNYIPKSYISTASPNYKTIKNLVSVQNISKLSITSILFCYANIFLTKAGFTENLINSLLKDFQPPKAEISTTKSFIEDYPLKYEPMEDTLGMLYLSLRSLQDKKSTGAYYTPYFVVDLLVKKALDSYDFKNSKDFSDLKIADPACGSGNFLIRLPKNIPISNIHGFDIDKVAVILCRINLALKYKISSANDLNLIKRNISCTDFLLDNSLKHKSFELMIGNPPWGYSYSSKEKSMIKNRFSSFDGSGKPESFSLFLERAIDLSNKVSFLLPETILGSDYHRGIRQYIQNNTSLSQVTYLGDVFDKVQCPSVVLSLEGASEAASITCSVYKKNIKTKEKLEQIRSFNISTFRLENSDNFHILSDDKEYAILQKMDNTSHFTLKGNAEFALGIVSGSNSTAIVSEKNKDYEPIIRGKNIEKFWIIEPSEFTFFSPDSFQQVAPEKMYREKNKLFYRFIASEPIVAIDREGLLSLNSANIIIPRIEGYSNEYIMAILNSSAMSFYYRHTFKNMKVLRSALESLPIPICNHKQMLEITDIADKLSRQKSTDSEVYNKELLRLDYLVASLYNLNTDEIEKIKKQKFTFAI